MARRAGDKGDIRNIFAKIKESPRCKTSCFECPQPDCIIDSNGRNLEEEREQKNGK